MTGTVNPEATAVAHFLILDRLMERAKGCVSKDEEKKVGRPVRSRLREAPGLALSTGAASLITFYLSKSDPQLLEALCKVFTKHSVVKSWQDAQKIVDEALGVKQNCKEGIDKSLKDELIRGGSGYSVVLSMILSYLESLGLQKLCDGNVVNMVASFAKGLFEDSRLDSFVGQVLLPYFEAAKRLVDAVVKGEAD